MRRTAQEIFQLHNLQQRESYLQGVHGTYLFDIEGVGSWFVKVDDGTVTAERARRDADCTIRCNEEDFVNIVEGAQNLLTATLRGQVQVSGDLALAQKFHGLVSLGADRKRGAA